MVFIMGAGLPPRTFVGYAFSMEFLPLKNTALATSLTFCGDGLVLMWASLFFIFIDNNWKSFYGIVVITTFVTFIALGFFPESPRFLANKGRFDETRSVISKIAKKNKLTKFDTREGDPIPNTDGLLIY